MWELIDKIRAEKQIPTVKFLAEVGISPGNYYAWKNGKCSPTFKVMARIGKVLDTSLDIFADAIQ